MNFQIENINIIGVTAANVAEAGLCCIKDKKAAGYKAKVEWFKLAENKGLKIFIACDNQNRQLGFIECIPSELAWRPIKAKNYLFIQCIAMYVKDAREKGIGSMLIKHCEKEAKENKKSGICAMSSEGVWMANKSLFEKNNFILADKSGRFELMYKAFDDKYPLPAFNNWTKEQARYKGWNIIYADQCPWHQKSVNDLQESAIELGINLNIVKINTAKEAQLTPSGFGTFSLINDGRLLADHYISRTRFENIIKQELKRNY